MPEQGKLGVTDRLDPRGAELTERVAWFIVLRWLAVAGMVLAVPAGRYLLGFEHMAAGRILALAACLFVLNCAYVPVCRALRRRSAAGRRPDLTAVGIFASAQIVLDLVILTAILHFSGGIQNPFSFYYVFHVVIASILLKRRSAYGVAALGAALYSAMVLLEHFGVTQFYPLAAQHGRYSPGYVITSILALGSTLFIGVYMVASIMTRLQQKEDELEKALREVRQLEATKSRFLMLVSHEMRSPIVAVQSILDALHLTSGGCLGSRGAQMLARAGERAESLLTLTRDLLTLSRQQTAEPDSERVEKVDMAQLTRSGVQLYRTQADERGIRLVEEYPDTSFCVSGDPDSLRLVISNLLSNAIRYTPPAGEVRVLWKLQPPRAVLEVSDTGIGIPESEMPEIFEEFFRAHNAKDFTASGTGLGLAITRNVVEKIGGSISVESRENHGTTFTVRLPAADA